MQKISITDELIDVLAGLDQETALNILTHLNKPDFTNAAQALSSASLTNESYLKKKAILEGICNFIQPLTASVNINDASLNDNDLILDFIKADIEQNQRFFTLLQPQEFPTEWQTCEKSLNLSVKMLQQLNSCRYYQLQKGRSIFSFYAFAYSLFNVEQKAIFKKHLPDAYNALDFLYKINAKDEQFTLADSFYKLHIENKRSYLSFIRSIYNLLQLTADEKEIFSTYFPLECKWLNYENDANNLSPFHETQFEAIDDLFEVLHANKINFKDYLIKYRNSPQIKITEDQLTIFLHTFSEVINQSHKKTKKDKPKKQLSQKRALEQSNGNSPPAKIQKLSDKKANLSVNAWDNIDQKIYDASIEFMKRFKGSSNATEKLQKTYSRKKKKFLKYTLVILPTGKNGEKEVSQTLEAITKYIGVNGKLSEQVSNNILHIDRKGNWKSKNAYFKKNGEYIGDTIEKKYPVDTFVLRGSTACRLAEKSIEQYELSNKYRNKTQSQHSSRAEISGSLQNGVDKSVEEKQQADDDAANLLLGLNTYTFFPKEPKSKKPVTFNNGTVSTENEKKEDSIEQQRKELIADILKLKEYFFEVYQLPREQEENHSIICDR